MDLIARISLAPEADIPRLTSFVIEIKAIVMPSVPQRIMSSQVKTPKDAACDFGIPSHPSFIYPGG